MSGERFVSFTRLLIYMYLSVKSQYELCTFVPRTWVLMFAGFVVCFYSTSYAAPLTYAVHSLGKTGKTPLCIFIPHLLDG